METKPRVGRPPDTPTGSPDDTRASAATERSDPPGQPGHPASEGAAHPPAERWLGDLSGAAHLIGDDPGVVAVDIDLVLAERNVGLGEPGAEGLAHQLSPGRGRLR